MERRIFLSVRLGAVTLGIGGAYKKPKKQCKKRSKDKEAILALSGGIFLLLGLFTLIYADKPSIVTLMFVAGCLYTSWFSLRLAFEKN